MTFFPRSLLLRPRLMIALGAVLALAVAMPGDWRWATRFMIAWDVGTVLYLALLSGSLLGESVEQIKARAQRQDEGALAILVVACLAAGASLAAIVAQLSGLGDMAQAERGPHLALGGLTILCSWTLIHVFFTLHYAGEYYTEPTPGLDFPGDGDPDYVDFLYFAFTIGCTSQTSDVAVTTRAMRGLTLCHSILAFVFNTSILAMAINVGASLVSGGAG